MGSPSNSNTAPVCFHLCSSKNCLRTCSEPTFQTLRWRKRVRECNVRPDFPIGSFRPFALCRLQGASPDLLPMVVLAGSRVRRSQITQYYNRLIGKRFILIYAIFFVAFASPGSALYCRGLVLASGFL